MLSLTAGNVSAALAVQFLALLLQQNAKSFVTLQLVDTMLSICGVHWNSLFIIYLTSISAT
jgi:hypothetical protein